MSYIAEIRDEHGLIAHASADTLHDALLRALGAVDGLAYAGHVATEVIVAGEYDPHDDANSEVDPHAG